jgi:hypothetical protein
MKGMSKEKAERFSHLERDGENVVVEQIKEEEGIEMETKPEIERRRKNEFFRLR